MATSRIWAVVRTPSPTNETGGVGQPAPLHEKIAGRSVPDELLGADRKVTESVLESGAVLYRDPLTHWAENIGDTTIHLILVELKK